MELTVLREELLHPLQKIQSIIEKKSTMPILSHTLLDAKEDSLEVIATSLGLTFKGVCKAIDSEPGKIVVPARALYEIVKNLDCEAVHLKKNENQWLEIRGGKSFFGLASLPVEEFPLFPEIERFNLVPVAAELIHKAFAKTYFSIAKEELDADLAGLGCEKRDKKLRFASTDRFRLTYLEIPFEDVELLQFEKNIMIPKRGVLEVLKINPQETLQIGFDDKAGIIKVGNDLLYMRLMENKFPLYEHVIPEKNEYEARISKAGLKSVLRRMSVLVTEDVKVADFLFSKDRLTVLADNPEIGKAEDTLEIEFPFPEVSFSFNILHLLDVLNVLESETFIFGLNTAEKTPCIITGEEDIGFKALIVPIMEKEERK